MLTTINNQIPFLYKWTELSTGKWYVGSRTAKNCHPDDGYICSSKIVKSLIKENPNNWQREVLCIGSIDYIVRLETSYLKMLNARDNPLSYNMHNNDGIYSRAGIPSTKLHKEKIREALAGKSLTTERKLNISKARIGYKVPNVIKQKISNTLQNRLITDEHAEKISKALTGKAKSKTAVEKNRLSQYERPKYKCQHCDKIISGMGNLKQHIASKHKEIK